MATYTPFDYSKYVPGYRQEDDETPAGAVPPQEPKGYEPAYGGVPAVPSPATTLQQTIAANLGMMPDIKGLGRKASAYFWNQTVGRVPGYEDVAAQSMQNIAAAARGEIPEDVKYQLAQGAAERGVSRGGGFSEADYLRSLGLTSLEQQRYAEGALTGALQRAESVPLFDISKYMLSPQDVYSAQMLSNIYGAAPIPGAAAGAARSTIDAAARTTPGMFMGMPSLGGGGYGAAGSPSALWAQQWAPVGGAGTAKGETGSLVDYEDIFGTSEDLGFEDLGFEDLGYEDLGFEDYGLGDYYDYSPEAYYDYGGYV